jgi:hypothetical protein
MCSVAGHTCLEFHFQIQIHRLKTYPLTYTVVVGSSEVQPWRTLLDGAPELNYLISEQEHAARTFRLTVSSTEQYCTGKPSVQRP